MTRKTLSKFRHVLPVAVVAFMAPAGAAAGELSERDRADVAKVEAYLNSIRTLRANFLQIGPRGGIARGKIFISRPGRLRVEYAPPAKILMVSTPVWLIYYDGEINEATYLPINSTPAGFLVQKNIRLQGKVKVIRVKRENGLLFVTINRSETPQKGTLTLIFSQKPLSLRNWTVVDAQGLPTRVTLRQVQTGIPLKAKLFQFVKPSADPSYDR